MDGSSVFISREMMIQSWHIELKYRLSSAPQLTLTINHIIYCQSVCSCYLTLKTSTYVFLQAGDFVSLFFDDVAND